VKIFEKLLPSATNLPKRLCLSVFQGWQQVVAGGSKMAKMGKNQSKSIKNKPFFM